MTMFYKKITRAFVSNVVGLILSSFIITGFKMDITDYQTILIAAGILVIVHLLVKPLIKLISFPINVITLGFFEFVINALLLYLVVLLVDQIQITKGVLDLGVFGIIVGQIKLSKFGTVLASATTISIINWLLKIVIF